MVKASSGADMNMIWRFINARSVVTVTRSDRSRMMISRGLGRTWLLVALLRCRLTGGGGKNSETHKSRVGDGLLGSNVYHFVPTFMYYYPLVGWVRIWHFYGGDVILLLF